MKRLFSLSPRLQAVADLVPEGADLVDVGTDHGRLPVWLACQGRIPSAVATDLRSGPLSRGKALASQWGVEDRISFRLCDGLAAVSPEEGWVITITGMGGETIADILDRSPWTRTGYRRYILQPMSGADGLRRYLSENSFAISREILIREGDVLYVILLAEPGKMEPLSPGEIWVGRQWKGMDSPLRESYLTQELAKLHWAIDGLARAQHPQEQEKQNYFSSLAREVAQMKKEWEQWQR